METAGTDRNTSVIVPSRGASDPDSIPEAPEIKLWTREADRAMLLLESLPNDPSGPGGRPSARAAAARWAVHRAAHASEMSRAISWRMTGSVCRPVVVA